MDKYEFIDELMEQCDNLMVDCYFDDDQEGEAMFLDLKERILQIKEREKENE